MKSSRQYIWLNVEYKKEGIINLIKNIYYKLVKTSKTKNITNAQVDAMFKQKGGSISKYPKNNKKIILLKIWKMITLLS